MRAKEYLMQIELLQAEIEQMQQQASEYRDLALSSGGFDYSKDRVQTSNLGGQIENPVIRYLDLEKDIMDSTYELMKKRFKIIGEIHNLKDICHIRILYKRYVEVKNLYQVAEEMGYSYDRVRHKHGDALKEFELVHNLFTKIDTP